MSKAADIADELLPQVKIVVRATDSVFDAEVETLIASAVSDMLRCGVSESVFEEDHAYHAQAVAAVHCYCKAYFGGDNPNEEMRFFGDSYRQHVCDLLNSDANVASG